MSEDTKPWAIQDFDDDSDDSGLTVAHLCQSVATWSCMQQRSVSVAEAALAFNTTPDVVQHAINEHGGFYLYLIGEDDDPTEQFIEHDGE
ncbi:hypothetical protein [Kaistia sp. MMO-174]|uniref:hypothetical protein n=1 Tax=Kaistia sp. MMO-174 TaxID=3081256 RepID=UPI0030179DDE